MFKQNPIIFIGAGPGDPDLITVAGKKALEKADVVIYAGSLVSREVLGWAPKSAELIDSAALDLDGIIEAMGQAWRAGRKVVRLHTGDPCLYGAIREQMYLLDKQGVPWKVIPGVTAAFSAAAELGLEYTLPETTQTLIITRAAGRTPVPESEGLSGLAAHGSSMAIYLSVGQAAKVSLALSDAFGPEAPVCVVYRSSWPDQEVLWTSAATLENDLSLNGITRQALILAGPGVEAVTPGPKSEVTRSKLYDPKFSHGYRKSDGESA